MESKLIPCYEKLKPRAEEKTLDLTPSGSARRTDLGVDVFELDCSEVLVTVSANTPDHIGLWFSEVTPMGSPTGHVGGQVLTRDAVVVLINRLHLAMHLLDSSGFTGRMDIRAGWSTAYVCEPRIVPVDDVGALSDDKKEELVDVPSDG